MEPLYYDYCVHGGHAGRARLLWSGHARISGDMMYTAIQYFLDRLLCLGDYRYLNRLRQTRGHKIACRK